MKLPDELKRFRFDGDDSQTTITMRGVLNEVSEAVVRYCANLCIEIEMEHWRTYKRQPGPHAYDPHYQGMSDGAGECGQAILAAFELEEK